MIGNMVAFNGRTDKVGHLSILPNFSYLTKYSAIHNRGTTPILLSFETEYKT